MRKAKDTRLISVQNKAGLSSYLILCVSDDIESAAREGKDSITMTQVNWSLVQPLSRYLRGYGYEVKAMRKRGEKLTGKLIVSWK